MRRFTGIFSKALLVGGAILGGMCGCVTVPRGVTPVENFEVERYLGKWYEIARLDHSFERGLDNVSAEYSLRPDGRIRVVNQGYDRERGKWREAKGRAEFAKSEETGFFRVSFFGPFYGSYIIFGLDEKDYAYSFVSGPTRSYLWLLARTPKVDAEIRERFVEEARQLGFPVEDIIFVRHDL